MTLSTRVKFHCFSVFSLALLIFSFSSIRAQVRIGGDQSSSSPDPAAILQLDASNRGFLLPRMPFTAMNSIVNPPKGLMVYVTSLAADEGFYVNVGTPLSKSWLKISGAAGASASVSDTTYNKFFAAYRKILGDTLQVKAGTQLATDTLVMMNKVLVKNTVTALDTIAAPFFKGTGLFMPNTVGKSASIQINNVLTSELLFNVNGSQKMSIDTLGNLSMLSNSGASLASPFNAAFKILEIHGGPIGAGLFLTNTAGSIGQAVINAGGMTVGTLSNLPLVFRVNQNDQMALDVNGSVTVGNNSSNPPIPSSTANRIFSVVGTAAGGGAYLFARDFSNKIRAQLAAEILTGTDSVALMGSYSNYPTVLSSNNIERMRIDTNGRVGIGTQHPQAPLHVMGINNVALNNGATSTAYWFANGTSGQSTTALTQTAISAPILSASATNNIAIIGEGAIVAALSAVNSDARIKVIKGYSNSKTDLALLNQIKITNYLYKDRIRNDNSMHKKVIAQQVEEVLPEAITKTRDFIPNILSRAVSVSYAADSSATITLDRAPDFILSDKVKVYNDKNLEGQGVVLSIQGNSFTMNGLTQAKYGEHIFVYGKEVADFRSVDYDAISMLNVSATQELSKQNQELKIRIDAQQVEIDELKSMVKKLVDKK